MGVNRQVGAAFCGLVLGAPGERDQGVIIALGGGSRQGCWRGWGYDQDWFCDP